MPSSRVRPPIEAPSLVAASIVPAVQLVVTPPDARFSVDAHQRVIRATMNPAVPWVVAAEDLIGHSVAVAFPRWLADVFESAIALARAYRRAVPFSYEWVSAGRAHARIGWARVRAESSIVDVHVSVLGTRTVRGEF
jgi:hypothetical protein